MTKEALKLAQEPSATRPCRSCNGTGDRDTGIPESPIATCKPCNGTGQIALAQPAQEPVAWQCREHGDIEWLECSKESYGTNPQRWVYRKLYTAPPQRPWVGLTDEDMNVVMEEESCSFIAGAKWAEEILKGKNT